MRQCSGHKLPGKPLIPALLAAFSGVRRDVGRSRQSSRLAWRGQQRLISSEVMPLLSLSAGPLLMSLLRALTQPSETGQARSSSETVYPCSRRPRRSDSRVYIDLLWNLFECFTDAGSFG